MGMFGDKKRASLFGVDPAGEYTPGMFNYRYSPSFGEQMTKGDGKMDALDMAAIGTSLIPGVGDAMGLLSDARMYATDPESRTWGNYAMSAAGMLPFVPPVAATAKDIGRAFEMLPERRRMLVDSGADPKIQSPDTLQPNRQVNLNRSRSPFQGPSLTEAEYRDILAPSKKRKKWKDERSDRYDANLLAVSSVRDARDKVSPRKFVNMDPLAVPVQVRLDNAKAQKSRQQIAEKYGLAVDDLPAYGKDIESAARKIVRSKELIAAAESTPLWSKSFAEEVIRDARIDPAQAADSINRANLEAVPRALKKEGWAVRHASSGKSGRKTSRYLVSPDGKFEVRLSDHYLPDRPERSYSHQMFGTRWNEEYVLSGAETPEAILDDLRRLRDEHSKTQGSMMFGDK